MDYKASIIIPLLNQQDEWLERCVRSALTQTASTEGIVVFSSKTGRANLNTLDRIVREGTPLRVLQRDGAGFANALNTGIREATTERVGFLLSDDWLDREAIEKCLPYTTDIVSTSHTNYAADGRTLLGITKRRTLAEFSQLISFEQKANYLFHFFLFKKSALLAVGGVDETIGLTGPDDYDLIWCLLENGATVSILEDVLYYVRDHTGERLTLRNREEQIEDLKKILDKHGVTGAEKDRLIRSQSVWFGRAVYQVVAERHKRTLA